jgi:DNA invertase Pin-like site-specific DNA recombinase
MMATVLAGIAEFKRKLTQQRIRSGIAEGAARNSGDRQGNGRSRIDSRQRYSPLSRKAAAIG